MTSPSCPPRIGVTCDFESRIDSRGCPSTRFWLHEGYVRALQEAGAIAYLLPYRNDVATQGALAELAPLDGLVVSGGHFDIPPERYGQSTHPLCGTLAPRRTDYELALLQAAWERGLPTLGICGGMQLMAVLAGGTLHQDVRLRPGTDVHEQPFDRAKSSHSVRLEAGSKTQAAFARDSLEVNSTHHQLVDDPGALTPVGFAPDGVIEAIEHPGERFALGVQWHPEAMADAAQQGIYTAFVQAARVWQATNLIG